MSTATPLALSVREVAAALGVSPDAIYDAIQRGDIPAVPVGTRRCVPRAWLEQTINDALAAASSARVTTEPHPPSARADTGEASPTTAHLGLGPETADNRLNGHHRPVGATSPTR